MRIGVLTVNCTLARDLTNSPDPAQAVQGRPTPSASNNNKAKFADLNFPKTFHSIYSSVKHVLMLPDLLEKSAKYITTGNLGAVKAHFPPFSLSESGTV
jgi:hypothetical protein